MSTVIVEVEKANQDLYHVRDQVGAIQQKMPRTSLPTRVREVVDNCRRAYFRIERKNSQWTWGERVAGDPGWTWAYDTRR